VGAADGVDDRVEDTGLEQVEVAAAQQRHDPLQVIVMADDDLGIVIAALLLHLVAGQAELEEVVRTHLFQNLDVGTIQGADGDGAVHHEFHVAGAGGLLAGGGELLREIAAGADHLHGADAVVGEEGHFQAITHLRVIVDNLSHVADQLDDQLGHGVARGGLAADQHAAIGPAGRVTALDAIIEMNDVQDIEQLAFVLVDALDLHVKQTVRVENHTTFGFDQ